MSRLRLLFFLLATLLMSCRQDAEKYVEPVSSLYDQALKPFYHGVASGDPLPDRVIIWTRVTPETPVTSIHVKWEIAEDSAFISVYKSDTLSATADHDYTAKVDVDALKPDRVYYYRFIALGKNSMTGRTKTAPVEATDSLTFAVVSCSNWEWGYFNAYDRIADRKVLDAVVHLGDYIYEYGTGKYGDTTIGRINIPPHEIVSLSDYRTRYSQYRLDKGLRRVHQNHPFIAIWDDHEIANNSYATGALNHQPEEGDYEKRKAAAKQVYYEWLPIREGSELYRSFSFGSLADLIMLDERLAGRTKQVDSLNDPSYNSDERAMLGREQLDWLESNLKASKATWRIIGNQVIISEINQGSVNPKSPRNLDSWDGYPAERKRLVNFINTNTISDIIFLTGDTHASWAMEATTKSTQGPFGVELGTTSIASANGDEYDATDTVKLMEQEILRTNPHIKYFNNRDHGYLLLTVYPNRAKSEWYYVETLRKPDPREFLGKRFDVEKGSTKLK